jgi:hypothetical protein
MRTNVSRAIRGAVLLHLATASVLVGCSSGSSGSAEGAGDDGGDPLPPCSIDTSRAVQRVTGSCDVLTYHFVGTTVECTGEDASALPAAACVNLCPPPPPDAGIVGAVYECAVGPSCIGCGDEGFNALFCAYECTGGGRRPAGLRAFTPRGGTPMARHLARAAYLEAASVPAFERLARELEAHGAPEGLRRRALRAAADEVRHAAKVTELASREGAQARVPRPRVRPPRASAGSLRSLEAVARENAVEGCVHETFAAAVALAQAARAVDPRVRAAMKGIAADEVRHAALAWAVARWAEARLPPGAKRRVEAARRRAARALVEGGERGRADGAGTGQRVQRVPAGVAALAARLGLPTAPEARALARTLAARLWDVAEAVAPAPAAVFDCAPCASPAGSPSS